MNNDITNEFIKSMSTIKNTYVSLEEGKTHINVNTSSNSELGRRLSWWRPINVKTIFGTVGTFQTFSWFLTKPEFPKEWLTASSFKKADVIRIKRMETVHVPNYWALICYLFVQRLVQEPRNEVLYMLRDNTLPLTVYSSKKMKEPYTPTQDVEITKLIFKLANYVAIIRQTELMIKTDRFVPSNYEWLISQCMFDKSKDLLDGVDREHKDFPEGLI